MSAQVQKLKTPGVYDGEWVRQSRLPGFKLAEIHYPDDFERSLHTHEHACFHFPFHGGYVEFQGRRATETKPLTLAFQPSGHEHSFRCSSEGMQTLSMEVDCDWLMRLREHAVRIDGPACFQSPRIQWILSRLRNELALMEPGSPLVMEALVVELAVEVSRRQLKPPERHWPQWLDRAKEFLHAHYQEPLTLGDVARAAEVHPVHLARTFREFLDCTVGDYVRKLRIEFACREIGQCDLSLREIAVASGFYDQSQFTRTFKRIVGVTPAEFRASLQLQRASNRS